MKRIFIAASLFALLSGMSSCKSSSSFENDVTKMGNYQCRVQKLLAKDQNDEKVKKEMAELKTEMDDYAMKMMTKYAKNNTKEMDEKAEKIIKEIMDKCK